MAWFLDFPSDCISRNLITLTITAGVRSRLIAEGLRELAHPVSRPG